MVRNAPSTALAWSRRAKGAPSRASQWAGALSLSSTKTTRSPLVPQVERGDPPLGVPGKRFVAVPDGVGAVPRLHDADGAVEAQWAGVDALVDERAGRDAVDLAFDDVGRVEAVREEQVAAPCEGRLRTVAFDEHFAPRRVAEAAHGRVRPGGATGVGPTAEGRKTAAAVADGSDGASSSSPSHPSSPSG